MLLLFKDVNAIVTHGEGMKLMLRQQSLCIHTHICATLSHFFFLLPSFSSHTQNCRQWRRRQQYWMYIWEINKNRGWSIEILSEFFSAAASFCYNIYFLPSHEHIKHILCFNTRKKKNFLQGMTKIIPFNIYDLWYCFYALNVINLEDEEGRRYKSYRNEDEGNK